STRYQQEAASIAAQVGKSLGEYCANTFKSSGQLPGLPAEFYPPYQAPPAFPALARVNAKQVSSMHGLFTATDACWQFTAPKAPWEVYAELATALKPEGWTPEFPLRKGNYAMTLIAGEGTRYFRVMAKYTEHSPYQFSARYVATMPKAAYQRAVDRLLATTASPEVIDFFLSSLPPARQEPVLLALHARTPGTAESWCRLAEFYEQHGKRVPARDALQRTVVLLRTVDDTSKIQPRIDALEKKLGKVSKTVTAAQLRACGFRRLNAAGTQRTIDIGLDEPFLVFWPARDGSMATLAIRIVRRAAGGYECVLVEKTETMSYTSREPISGNRLSHFSPIDLSLHLEIIVEHDDATPPHFTLSMHGMKG
ncbi:MAG TPA: hypothetical protein VGM23_07970, partial [Armatimonadota bacterium]